MKKIPFSIIGVTVFILGIGGLLISVSEATADDTQVNTYTIDSQGWPIVAMNPNGKFVRTWESGGQDGSGLGVYAQMYNNTGIAVGSEFNVNTHTTSDQFDHYLAMDSNGNFVITWLGPNGSDLSDTIYAQMFDSSGNTVGYEFQVNSNASGTLPSVAMRV